MKKTLFIQHHAPYHSEKPQETLDALLVCATFGQQVSLLFQDDGVWQLVADQQGHAIGKRTLGSQLQVLPLYDVERLYADAISLQERQIDAATLSLPVTILDTNALKQLIAEQNQLMRL